MVKKMASEGFDGGAALGVLVVVTVLVVVKQAPARIVAGRGLFDYKQTHWASWTLIGPNHRVLQWRHRIYQII